MKKILLIFILIFSNIYADNINKTELEKARMNFKIYTTPQLLSIKIAKELSKQNIKQQLGTMQSVVSKDNKVITTVNVLEQTILTLKNSTSESKKSNIEQFNKILISSLNNNQIQTFCTYPTNYVLLEKGVEFNYVYIIENKKLLGTTSIKFSDCKFVKISK